jgi:hypothetical protein
MAPPYSRNFSVKVVLPASGWEIIAKVLRREISVQRSDMRVLLLIFQTNKLHQFIILWTFLQDFIGQKTDGRAKFGKPQPWGAQGGIAIFFGA